MRCTKSLIDCCTRLNIIFKKQKEKLKDVERLSKPNAGALIETGQFKAAAFIRHLNKYFDEKKPWISVKQDIEDCQKVLFTCTLAIANLSVILQPFLPFSCLSIQETLNLSADEWVYFQQQSFTVGNVKPLFERIEPERISEETEKLLK